MDIETLNPYVIKILMAARKNDSISSISKRINLSYGWAHKWVKELIKEGIFKEKWKGLILQQNSKPYKEILKFVRKNVNETSFYYTALNLSGIEYALTKTDAVYFWTEGKYNVGRYRYFYPIFVKIKKPDYKIFLEYCRKLHLKINAKKGVFYVPEVTEDFKYEKKNGFSIEPLKETIAFMKKNIYNFQPALEMIKEIYRKKLNIKYKEIHSLQ